MDAETEELVKSLHKRIAELESRVAELEEVNLALTGELIKKNMDPDHLPCSPS